MDQLSFLWGWFPWRRETCLSRLNGWPGEQTPGRASIVISCVSGLLSCDGLMSPLGNVGSLLSAPMVSLLPPGLVLLGALVQSWLLSAELRVSMSGAARGCHRSLGGGVFQQHGHHRAQPVWKEEPGVWLSCWTQWWSQQTELTGSCTCCEPALAQELHPSPSGPQSWVTVSTVQVTQAPRPCLWTQPHPASLFF